MPPKKILVAVLLLSLQALAQNVVIAPSGNQNIVQPPNTSFSANDYAGIRYVVPNYNWQQSSSGTIMTGPNTVTLAPCPAGILVSPSPFQPSTRLWLTGGGGANEAVLVTATTCPLQGSTGGLGTVTFAAAYSHSGYTIGSASAGIQEAINAANFTTAAGFVQNGTVVVPPGSYTVNARITILGNGQSLQGAGATLSCYMNDTCLFIGDDINATLTSDVTVDGLSFQPNVAHNMFPMIDDNGQHSTIRGLRGQGSAGSMFGSMIQVDNDQSATIDGLDANYPPTSGVSWASCTSTFCSTIVRGASSSGNASVISIKNSVINAQCNANGVDMGTGGGFANTLRIADSIVQDYPQFGVRYRATYPNLGLVLDNVYQEVTCANPLFNNLQSQAGVIALGPQVRNTNGAAGAGNFPRFYSCTPVSTCTNTTFYSYWIVGHSTTYGPNGTTVPLLSGTGATDGTVAGGTIYWPQMCQLGSCGTVTYDLLRITSNMPGYSGIVPSGTLPGGVGDNGAVVTLNSGSCSNLSALLSTLYPTLQCPMPFRSHPPRFGTMPWPTGPAASS